MRRRLQRRRLWRRAGSRGHRGWRRRRWAWKRQNWRAGQRGWHLAHWRRRAQGPSTAPDERRRRGAHSGAGCYRLACIHSGAYSKHSGVLRTVDQAYITMIQPAQHTILHVYATATRVHLQSRCWLPPPLPPLSRAAGGRCKPCKSSTWPLASPMPDLLLSASKREAQVVRTSPLVSAAACLGKGTGGLWRLLSSSRQKAGPPARRPPSAAGVKDVGRFHWPEAPAWLLCLPRIDLLLKESSRPFFVSSPRRDTPDWAAAAPATPVAGTPFARREGASQECSNRCQCINEMRIVLGSRMCRPWTVASSHKVQ